MLKVTEDLEAPVVASATCAFRTVVHGYERLGAVEPHETIVIQGSGPVGLYALAYAVAQGAGQVICIGAPEARLQLAARWGASLTLNVETTSSEERLETVMANTDGRGADIVIECSGANVALPEGLALARRGGRYLVVGQADPRPVSVRGTDFNIRQLTVVGVLGGDIPHYFKAIRFLSENQSRFHFADLLGSRYSFDKVNEALGALAEGRELKPIIVNRPA
jgi:threonine dehydrogenase-like Zn-dependent dehydrogenase